MAASGERGRGGRPRQPELDGAVLEAAAALIAEHGYTGLRMDELARRAGTAKTAIYRRWPSRVAVVLDMLAAQLPSPVGSLSTGDMYADLVAAVRGLAEPLARPAVAKAVTGMLAESGSDPEIATRFRQHLVEPQIAAAEEAIDAARAAGRCPDWVTGALLGDVMAGATIQHMIVRGQPADDEFVGGLARLVMGVLGGSAESPQH